MNSSSTRVNTDTPLATLRVGISNRCKAFLDAAEATRSPIIIGFNGEFLSHPGRKLPERLHCYAELGKAAAASARCHVD